MEVGAIAFATEVDGTIDSALGADTVAAFDRDDREEFDFVSGFSELHGGHEASESSANDDYSFFGCHSDFFSVLSDLE